VIPFAWYWQGDVSMSKAYSEDLRQRIVEAVDGGMSRRQAAATYKVGVSSAIRYVQRWRATGSVKQDRMGQPGGSKLDPHDDWLLNLIKDEPDITLSEIGERLRDEHRVKASIGTLWNFFDRKGVSFKKNRARRRTRAA
jgi:transposase